MTVGGRVAGGAGMDAEVAGEGGSDVHLFGAVETVVGRVAEEALGTALVAQVAAVESVAANAVGAVDGAVADEAVRNGGGA